MRSIKLIGTGFLIFLALLVFSPFSAATGAASAIEMPIPPAAGNCNKCHSPATHPMNNCSGCHDLGKFEPAAVLAGGHGGFIVSDRRKLLSTAPVGNCLACHSYTNECMGCHPSFHGISNPVLTPDPNPLWAADYIHDATRINNFVGKDNTYKCEMCHLQQQSYGRNWWPAIPQHNLSVFGTIYSHQSTIGSGCLQCHDAALTREHYQRKGPAGLPLDCFTCHSSKDNTIRVAIKNRDTGCGACHKQAHNANLTPTIPAEIPLFNGFQWTPPIPLATWTGDTWVPAEFLPGGYRLISSRRSDVTADQVWNYYRSQLVAGGWTPFSPEPADNAKDFRVKFTKGQAGVLIWYYGGIYHSNDPVLPQGARIEIIYGPLI